MAERESIGIDDGSVPDDHRGVDSHEARRLAEQVDDAFQRVYLAFHRRDGKTRDLSAASRAVLVHLTHSGPVTIGEAATHLDRAQSVVSDVVTQLEGNGLVERQRDPVDHRRVLVWLTDAGLAAMRYDASVLSHDRLADAIDRLDADDVARAVDVLHLLARTARQSSEPEHRRTGVKP